MASWSHLDQADTDKEKYYFIIAILAAIIFGYLAHKLKVPWTTCRHTLQQLTESIGDERRHMFSVQRSLPTPEMIEQLRSCHKLPQVP